MEELTKTQIVLLTLLVSFVTSIATGIVTVSLLDQAPSEVTQTISRVVEKTVQTVEKVVPERNQASIVTKEVQVIIKENDLIMQAVEKSEKSLVRIFDVTDEKAQVFVGLGLVVSSDGLIVIDRSLIEKNKRYVGILADQLKIGLQIDVSDNDTGIAILAPVAEKDKKESPSFVAVDLADGFAIRLAQAIVALGGDKEKNIVSTGVITSIDEDADGRVIFETSVGIKDDAAGSYLINLNGAFVGMHNGEIIPNNAYFSVNIIKNLLASTTPLVKIAH